MDTIYSHPPEGEQPGVELETHLSDVATRVEHVVPAAATTPADESLQPVVEALAYVHDLGKATTYFQAYVLDDRHPKREILRHHAPLGAFAAYDVLDARGFDTETCLAGFVAVAKHHGRLPDVAEYVHERAHHREGVSGRELNADERRLAAVAKQIRDIDEHAADLAAHVFETASDGRREWTAFRDGFGQLFTEIAATVATSGSMPGVDREALSASCYSLVLQCWSALVLADKTSAAGAPNDAGTYAADPPALDRLDEYVRDIEAETSADPDGMRSERLNYHRSRARREVLDNTASVAAAGGGMATLTLPTGMGKTLTGLSAAFDLRDRLDGERVVYALPFTSVIDQVIDEVSDIYDTSATSRLLTGHHHLTETTFEDSNNDE